MLSFGHYSIWRAVKRARAKQSRRKRIHGKGSQEVPKEMARRSILTKIAILQSPSKLFMCQGRGCTRLETMTDKTMIQEGETGKAAVAGQRMKEITWTGSLNGSERSAKTDRIGPGRRRPRSFATNQRGSGSLRGLSRRCEAASERAH